jgi:hypothetical protein
MKNSGYEAERRKLLEIAADYEGRGYKVLVEPSQEKLPEFLKGFHPDLVARGPDESVVIEVKVGTDTAASERFRELAETIRRQPGWRFSLVVVDPRSDEVVPPTEPLLDLKDVTDALGRANELLKTGATEAAFLLTWVSVEALLRHIAEREGIPLQRVPSSSLIKELFSQGVLSRHELDVAQRAFSARNTLVHGFRADGLQETSSELWDVAQELLSDLIGTQRDVGQQGAATETPLP